MDLTNNNYIAKEISQDIKEVCKGIPKRSAGSEGEKAFADYVEYRLSRTANVDRQEFSIYPNAIIGALYISAICAIFAQASYFFTSFVSVLFALCAIVPIVVQVVLKKPFLDLLFSKKQSQNLTAVKKGDGDIKRTVYLVAQGDVSSERMLNRVAGHRGNIAVYSVSLVGLLYFLILAIVRWCLVGELGAEIASGAMLYAGFAGLIFFPFYLSLFFVIGVKKIGDGACESVLGAEVAMRLFDDFDQDNANGLGLGVILLGSESIGARGAYAWCEQNIANIDLDNTMFIFLENLYGDGNVCVGHTCFDGKKSDSALVEDLKCAISTSGVASEEMRIGSDSSARVFMENTDNCILVSGCNLVTDKRFKTRFDSADDVSEKQIESVYQVVAKYIENQSNRI